MYHHFLVVYAVVLLVVITYPYNTTLNINYNVKIHNNKNIMNYSKILL